MFKRAGTKKQFQIADIKLDPETNQVWRGSDEIALPKLSFQLLKVLIENSPNVLEQEELIGEVWPDMVVGDETLKQRVRLLRKALGDNAKSPKYIGAVRGRGYRLIPEVKILLINQSTPVEFDLVASDRMPNLTNMGTDKIWRNVSITLTAFIFILLTSLYLFKGQSVSSNPSRSIQNLAILPFINVTQNQEDDYLVSGMTNELILVMSEIKNLTITPKSETQKYLHNERVISKISNELNVGAILDGALYRQNNNLHLSFKLINSNNLDKLWQAEYDFESDDILTIQRKVITQVAKHLKAQLKTSNILDTIALTQPTRIVKAYDFYLKGRSYYNRYRQADNLTAIQFYQQALALDPQFALAYAGLADAYSQGVFQFGSDDKWRKLALDSALKAVALNKSKAETNKALGLAYYLNGNLKKAIELTLRAIKIAPRHAQSVTNIAYLYLQVGELDKALQWNKRAIELTPEYATAWAHQAKTFESMGRLNESESSYLKAVQLQPDYAFAYHLYANFLFSNDRGNEAISLLTNALKSAPNEYEYWQSLGEIYLFAGDYVLAQHAFEEAKKTNKTVYNLELNLLLSITNARITGNHFELDRQITLWKNQRTNLSDNPKSFFLLALALAAKDDFSQSKVVLNKAIELGWRNKTLSAKTKLLDFLVGLPQEFAITSID